MAGNPLGVGDPAPWISGRSTSNPDYKLHMAAGRWMALTFLLSAARPADGAVAKLLMADGATFDDDKACLFLVTADPADEAEARLQQRLPGIRVIWDIERKARVAFGVDEQTWPVSFLLTPRMQVAAVVTERDPDAHAATLLKLVRDAPSLDALPLPMTITPVLVVPGIFEPELCRRLIAGYEANGGRESGFMRDVDGKTVEIRDTSHKVRRDWEIEDKDFVSGLQGRFLRRVVPEIKKAFQFEVTRMERYIVACYAADEGGHFRAHRDNTTQGTAHRRFAVSVNLNAEDYDGGDLRFPEFGSRTYRAPTGGGVVFSCSLMHEATRVTRGKRYAFLPFLYDEAARKIREANFQFLASQAAAQQGKAQAAE